MHEASNYKTFMELKRNLHRSVKGKLKTEGMKLSEFWMIY